MDTVFVVGLGAAALGATDFFTLNKPLFAYIADLEYFATPGINWTFLGA